MRLSVRPEQELFVELDELIFRYGETSWRLHKRSVSRQRAFLHR